MKYVKYTYVDSITGIPVTDEPAANGPTQPDIEGLEFGFALESQYPTDMPIFYGTTPDEANADVPGVLAVITGDEYNEALAVEMIARRAVAEGLALDQLSAHRYQIEISGVTSADGIQQSTTRSERLLLADKLAFMRSNPSVESTMWKASGVWNELTTAQLGELQTLVGTHVNKCYLAEHAVALQVSAASTVSEVVAINLTSAFDDAFAAI